MSAAREGVPERTFWDRVGQLTVVLGPTTVLTGWLYYVGYVSTDAFYAYFGVSLSSLDVSSTTFLLRSVDDLFDPVSTVVLVALGAFSLHHVLVAAVSRRHLRPDGRVAAGLGVAALVLAGVGIAGLSGLVRSGLTPVALGLSGVVLEYACLLTAHVSTPSSTLGILVRSGANLRRGLVAALVLVALLWGATALADQRGTARALAVERSLPLQPQAVVYSRIDLRLTGAGIRKTGLEGTGDDLRFRYNGLRPLAHSDGTWLLLPVGWTSRNGTTVIRLTESPQQVRVDLAR